MSSTNSFLEDRVTSVKIWLFLSPTGIIILPPTESLSFKSKGTSRGAAADNIASNFESFIALPSSTLKITFVTFSPLSSYFAFSCRGLILSKETTFLEKRDKI